MIVSLCASATLLFCILAVLVSTGVTQSFDSAVLLWINQYANATLDAFFVSFTQLGGLVFMVVAGLALLAYFLYKKRYSDALFAAVSLGGVAVVNVILKSIFERPRPDLWDWLIHETSMSFPSGHATATMALAMCILILVWRTKWRLAACITLFLYVVSIGISRLYLGVHYPTDILGGWLLGIAWVTFVAWMIRRYGRKAKVLR